ncbi:hypothetical protein QUF50_00135 [Thiotrichales bacterium HSG1]|nr:hypothetical protein [Thiotrichales bacterium HSG1]
MFIKKYLIIFSLLSCLIPLPTFATSYWTPMLQNWNLYLDNGVAYVNAYNMPSHCIHRRAEIEITTDDKYQNFLFDFTLAMYQLRRQLKIVIDNDQTVCKIMGVADK